ncbi:MAG TPA: radical SAM protein [Thermoanaerobaculia bacterium]|nr:radical SAM protein [Thermoanaerobaculia bacterium]
MKHDLVLVYPDISAGRFTAFRKHLGAGYLLAYLQGRGITGTFYRQAGNLPLSRVADEIAARSGRYVGFTCFDSNFYYISLLARLIKERAPHLTVLLGGPSATFSSELILHHVPEVDACFKGMAEEPLTRYIEASEADKLGTPGLVFRDGDRIVQNPPLAAGGGKHGADAFPSPYLTGVFGFDEAPHLGLLSSRGCFYQCTFCNFSAMANWRIQFHSPGRVLAELQGIHERFRGRSGAKPHVVFYDDFFTAGKARLAEICRGIIDGGISRTLTFKCCTRADWVDQEVLEMLREAGFTKIVFGLESGSPEILRAVKKLQPSRPRGAEDCEPERAFLEKFRQSVREAKEAGLEVYSSIILGLPGESPEQARGTIDFVESLGLDGYNHNFLQVFPGTELFDNAAQYGIHVQPSATVLPYLTYYTYDVTQVPVLDLHGNITDARRQMAGDLSRAFFPREPKKDTGTFAYAWCEAGDLANAPGLWPWLGENVSPLTRLVFRQRGTAEFRPEDVYPRLIDASIPIVNYLSIYPIPEEGKVCCEDVRRGTRTGSSVLGLEMRETDAEGMAGLWDRLLGGAPPEPAFHVAGLSGREDLEKVAGLLARRAPGGRLPLTPGFLEQQLEVTNACQLGLSPCPVRATEGFPNAVLRADGAVLPCFAGPAVGSCGTCAKDLRSSFDRLFADRERERDCDRCPQAGACSRCPTLDCAPVLAGEVNPGVIPFLELVRQRHRVLGLMQSRAGGELSLLLGPLAFRRHGSAPPDGLSFLPQSALVFADGEDYFLMDLASGGFYELNRVMVEVYEALSGRVPGEDVIGYFTSTYGLGRQEVSESLGEAAGILQNLFEPRAEQAAASL